MNPLQELIRRRMAERDWSYSDVARRGSLPRSTVHHLAKNERPARSPHPQTLTRLAEGLELPAALVRSAAARAAGHEAPEYEVAAYQPTAFGTAGFHSEPVQSPVFGPGPVSAAAAAASARTAAPATYGAAHRADRAPAAAAAAGYDADDLEVHRIVSALRQLSREDRRQVALLVRSLLERRGPRLAGRHSPARRP